jgi:hypothetical protein
LQTVQQLYGQQCPVHDFSDSAESEVRTSRARPADSCGSAGLI